MTVSQKTRGRPSKLTSELRRRICKLLKAGDHIKTVCDTTNITQSTFYLWRDRGETDLEQNLETEFSEFSEAVRRARAIAESRNVQRVLKSARGGEVVTRTTVKVENGVEVRTVSSQQLPGDWRAAAWWLEKSFPQRWGNRTRLEHSGPDGGPIPTGVVITMPDNGRGDRVVGSQED